MEGFGNQSKKTKKAKANNELSKDEVIREAFNWDKNYQVIR